MSLVCTCTGQQKLFTCQCIRCMAVSACASLVSRTSTSASTYPEPKQLVIRNSKRNSRTHLIHYMTIVLPPPHPHPPSHRPHLPYQLCIATAFSDPTFATCTRTNTASTAARVPWVIVSVVSAAAVRRILKGLLGCWVQGILWHQQKVYSDPECSAA